MKDRGLFRKILVSWTILLFVGLGILPSISDGAKDIVICSAEQTNVSIPDNGVLDVQYIYNITRALSNIIFTEYDEEHGEIAKGRFFGTKGEHKAAEILYENMTKLGLYTTMEKIGNTPMFPKLTHITEVLEYGLKVNNETVFCRIIPSTKGPRENSSQLNYNFSFKNLKVKLMPKFLIPWALSYKLSNEKEDFVFIDINAHFIPDADTPIHRLLYEFINPLRFISYFSVFNVPSNINKKEKSIQLEYLYKIVPQWKGTIGYDLNDETCNMGALENQLPRIYINGTVGKKILEDIDNVTIDFYLNQSYNDSVISYNVIGQLNGTDPSKTVIVDCLYDSWWCQGTGDSAIGMAMVLGIAKYFKDHNITPKYNIKFIGFGGEEVGMRGAIYYEYAHRREKIIYVIDLNQIGFRQEEPRLALNIIANKLPFLNEIWKIAKKTDYVKEIGNTADIKPLWMPVGAPSDDKVFAIHRPLCKTVCFLKSFYWILHHRDSLDHMEGDVMKYFDWDDVNATGEIVLNVTKYLTVDK